MGTGMSHTKANGNLLIKRAVSLKTQVYELIRNSIVQQELDIGLIYSEQWFADYFDVSRTPVREALLQLRQEELIEVLPNRGVRIRQVTLEDAKDVYQTRIAIEGYCVALLAKQRNNEDVMETIQRIEELNRMVEHDFNYASDYNFHLEMIKYANNPEFLKQISRMRSRIDLLWGKVFQAREIKMSIVQEHQKIIDCIKAGDAIGAYRACEAHLNNTFYYVKKSNFFDASKPSLSLDPIF